MDKPPLCNQPFPVGKPTRVMPTQLMDRPDQAKSQSTSSQPDLPSPFQRPIRRIPLIPIYTSPKAATLHPARCAPKDVFLESEALPGCAAIDLSKSSDPHLGRRTTEVTGDPKALQGPDTDWVKADAELINNPDLVDKPETSLTEHPRTASHMKEGRNESDRLEEEIGLFIPMDQTSDGGEQRRKKRCNPMKRKRDSKQEEKRETAVPPDLDNPLDRNLDDRAKQHNLTVVNVRNILHEVITNEHVVAMMKAAIADTPDLPPFEPKMTRSKLKEVVEKGVVIPTWDLSRIKISSDVQVPQFVDIPLEEEDSSDEEYRPEEEEEDETAEESLLESDIESTASSPRGHKRHRSLRTPGSPEESLGCQQAETRLPVCGSNVSPAFVPMGPPPPPKVKSTQDSSFMEELHAVDEELDRSQVCMDSYQSLDESLIAFRTRSKRPLKDVPIGQLEAELKAPDITPDMYDPNTADDEDWKVWLRSLMEDDLGNEDEADDDDDPEYNILDDLEEPDTEDLRNDRAVRITKKEVSELMEELFETFQDEGGFSHMVEDGPDDEDSNPDTLLDFNTPQAIRFEEPLANLLNKRHRTVKAQLEFLRMRKSMSKPEGQESETCRGQADEEKPPVVVKANPVLGLNAEQKRRLQQQMQQHVQLLAQMHLLACRDPRLSMEADSARVFLVELSSFAENSALTHRAANPEFQSTFQACNLKEALQLLCVFHSQIPENNEPPEVLRKNASEIIGLSSDIAWIVATRPLFMYPELLPVCGLKATGPRDRVFFTKAEDSLFVLGLKHFEGTEYSKALISKYLVVAKTPQQLTARFKNLTMKKSPDNIIKFYRKTKSLPAMVRCCEDVQPPDAKPPLEREKHRLPCWLKASLTSIEAAMKKPTPGDGTGTPAHEYPLLIPPGLRLTLKPVPSRSYRKTWRQKRSSILKPLMIRPSSSANTSNPLKQSVKTLPFQPLPIKIVGGLQPFVPVPGIAGVNPLNVQIASKAQEAFQRVPLGARSSNACPASRPAVAAQFPVAQTKVTAPPPASQRVRKPLLGGVPRRKIAAKSLCFRAAPFSPSPLILAVPNTALKLVSLGAPCGVIQPVGSSPGVPLTTVLLNPSSIPVAQTLIPSSFSKAFVTMPPAVPEDQTADKHKSKPFLEAAAREDGRDCESIKVLEDGGMCENGEGEGKEQSTEQGEEKECSERHCPLEDGGNCPADGGPVLSPPDCMREEKSEHDPADQPERLQPVEIREKEETDAVAPHAHTQFVRAEDPAEPEDMQNPHRHETSDPPEGETRTTGGPSQTVGAHTESPQNTPSVDGEMDMSGPAEMHHDTSSPLGQQQEANDKDCPDEEEEEDFDDLTQDEDEEELSSASEESVLSVPELQETMEKLTWLASERRLSQEGDSEENSQEENSEPEEEEEEAEEALEISLQKEEGETREVLAESTKSPPSRPHVPTPVPAEPVTVSADEPRKGSNKGRSSYRVRSRRGRARTSRDASKLLHLYDENILLKDPMREQKDMAFAQEYLNRVREALKFVPGKYEQFLHLIYQFESSRHTETAVDLYEKLCDILGDWPQLLRDFAAFLLPEQALECGLFPEQQAFDKSRKFLRQLEICFLENPAHYQKIIRLLQSCVDFPLQEINKLKAQMWQLLKGHNHLQDEFSLFFDQVRPPASRLGDFEVVNWTGDKEYKFDGFEEVALPDVEEEEESGKIQPPHRSRKRKESNPGQEVDLVDGGKDSACSCLEAAEQRVKRCKRRMCSKGCESRSHQTKAISEGTSGGAQSAMLLKEAGAQPVPVSIGNCEGRLPLPKVTELEDRLIATAQVPARDKYFSSAGRPVPAREKDISSTGSPVPAREKDISSTGSPVPARDKDISSTGRPVPARDKDTAWKTHAVKGSHTTLPAQKALYGGPFRPGSDRRSLGDRVPTCSSINNTDCVSQDDRDPSMPPIPESSRRQEKPSTVCAKNIAVSSSGKKVILWTREADRVILTACQERGAQEETFAAISAKLGNKSPAEVSDRFRELVCLFQTSCASSSDEEEASSATDQTSDQDAASEEDIED